MDGDCCIHGEDGSDDGTMNDYRHRPFPVKAYQIRQDTPLPDIPGLRKVNSMGELVVSRDNKYAYITKSHFRPEFWLEIEPQIVRKRDIDSMYFEDGYRLVLPFPLYSVKSGGDPSKIDHEAFYRRYVDAMQRQKPSSVMPREEAAVAELVVNDAHYFIKDGQWIVFHSYQGALPIVMNEDEFEAVFEEAPR